MQRPRSWADPTDDADAAELLILTPFRVRLLGSFSVASGDSVLKGLSSGKANELFCYLLLHRDVPHSRETLATQLWEKSSISQAKDYLRHALWQLQSALARQWAEARSALRLRVGPKCICLETHATLWLDVAVVENAVGRLRGIPGGALDPMSLSLAREATELYRGDFLEGSAQEWCRIERERLRQSYVRLVEKLLVYYDAHRDYDNGVAVGQKLLAMDRAHERTHRRLMRLRYGSGDRLGALRQFEQCRDALAAELGVRPSRQTLALYERIRTDSRPDLVRPADASDREPDDVLALLSNVLVRIGQIEADLAELRQLVRSGQ